MLDQDNVIRREGRLPVEKDSHRPWAGRINAHKGREHAQNGQDRGGHRVNIARRGDSRERAVVFLTFNVAFELACPYRQLTRRCQIKDDVLAFRHALDRLNEGRRLGHGIDSQVGRRCDGHGTIKPFDPPTGDPKERQGRNKILFSNSTLHEFEIVKHRATPSPAKGGTRSGRFSSDSPNLQNIPTRSDLGKLIRRCFADPYRPWRKYDYSQIEYRFLVHFAVGHGSDEIRRVYAENPDTDYHQITHDLIFDITGVDLIRAFTKNINFGLIYGEGEDKLGRELGVTASKAKEMFAAYHKAVPFAKETMKACSTEAEIYGMITTVLGRRSRFDLWEPSSFSDKRPPLSYANALMKYGNIKRAYSYRALNRRLQGSAADQMKLAMHKCWKDGIFAETGIPRLTVHDELDFVDDGGKDKAFAEMKHVMETCMELRVPVRADYEIGPNWGDVKAPT